MCGVINGENVSYGLSMDHRVHLKDKVAALEDEIAFHLSRVNAGGMPSTKRRTLMDKIHRLNTQRMALSNQLANLERVRDRCDDMVSARDTVASIKAGVQNMRLQMTALPIDHVESVMDEMAYLSETVDDMTRTISSPVGLRSDMIDDDALEAELAALSADLCTDMHVPPTSSSSKDAYNSLIYLDDDEDGDTSAEKVRVTPIPVAESSSGRSGSGGRRGGSGGSDGGVERERVPELA